MVSFKKGVLQRSGRLLMRVGEWTMSKMGKELASNLIK